LAYFFPVLSYVTLSEVLKRPFVPQLTAGSRSLMKFSQGACDQGPCRHSLMAAAKRKLCLDSGDKSTAHTFS